MTVVVNCENQNKKRRIDLSKIKGLAKAVLRDIGEGNAEVNILLLSNQKIRALNRVYFKEDLSTDVISFPSGEKPSVRKGRKFLGDIAISSDKAAGNCKVYKTTFKEELALYIIHGILHLTGYKDATRKEQLRMRKKEDEIIQKIRRFI